MNIPFNKPYLTSKEISYIQKASELGKLSGDGHYTNLSSKWLEENLQCKKILLTHSCTAALEMAAILANLEAGDEVIMPSYTFVSTANAFVLRGAVPVFIDIKEDSLNLDERLIEDSITEKTKAIVPVHYAGVPCEMDTILEIAKRKNLFVIEDTAQAIFSKYKGKFAGTLGDFGTLSFHETKNIISGEGGALMINNPSFAERAEIIREKGTNRSKFFRGQTDKYTWVDIGSSYLPSEIIAAFLYAQLEDSQEIQNKRNALWNNYHKDLLELEDNGYITRPKHIEDIEHNSHMYYILLKSLSERQELIEFLKKRGILSVFHYIPLHSSPAGKKYGRYKNELPTTDRISDTLLRLPLYYELSFEEQSKVISFILEFFNK
jgi:dTDP-4-amino-4,6-dideoxygalactose transaminase